MEYGIICLLPPIIAIVLALKTKQTLPSLFIAVWVGATIIKGWNPIAGFTAIISEYMIPSICKRITTPDFWFLLLCLVDLLTC